MNDSERSFGCVFKAEVPAFTHVIDAEDLVSFILHLRYHLTDPDYAQRICDSLGVPVSAEGLDSHIGQNGESLLDNLSPCFCLSDFETVSTLPFAGLPYASFLALDSSVTDSPLTPTALVERPDLEQTPSTVPLSEDIPHAPQPASRRLEEVLGAPWEYTLDRWISKYFIELDSIRFSLTLRAEWTQSLPSPHICESGLVKRSPSSARIGVSIFFSLF